MMSVMVGFLYIAVLKFVDVFVMVMSRKFKAWFCSNSAVN
jgi:hypothetical protein